MLKAIGNLLIILLICIGASGISIFYSPILDESITMHENNEEITLLATSEADDILLNPESIYIKYKTNKNAILIFNENHQFTARIYKDEEIYKVHNIYHNSPTQVEFTKDTPYSVNIDISKKTLDLPNGEYKIEIIPNIIDNPINIEPLTFNIKYLSDVPYIPATSNIPDGKIALNLHFLDAKNSVKQLIGITRFIDDTKRPLTTLMEELKKGPAFELGLNMNPIIGAYNYVSLKGNTAYVDLPSKESMYTEDIERSEAAMNAFIKSLSSYPGVDNVRFLVDYNRAKTFFNDQDVTKSFTINNENKAFLAYDSPNRYFLVECNIEGFTEEMAIEDKVILIFNSLQNSNYDYLSSTVPSEVKLLSSRLENDVLVVIFNSSFLNAYNSNDNLNRMMLDSVILSFTSLKEVNKVKILVDGETVNNFAGLNLYNEIARPLFINPEN
ncbi:GerMN domain-containing protein [Proteiniborus sp. MB09-C3]|uniref:GerMN domain-containing protein n=1 Tax=Proteiniborus sp. MB09-C3 TaxID=3050072 RepID=UPI0025565B41|nr:GerMN domain-containing protein [Proteiniborus sp. MB09-C3]WIV13552.1 GerMN domain-containing protein [Proteiniborus sp. MB09-C3]